MFILHDEVIPLRAGQKPDYRRDNPLTRLFGMIEQASFAAGREHYVFEDLQYLFPVSGMTLYGPAGNDSAILDPLIQDNKTDFQKQNLQSIYAADTQLIRGWVCAGDWSGPFLRVTYRAGLDSVLAHKARSVLSDSLLLYLKVGANAHGDLLRVPYDERSGRYALELWGWTGSVDDLRGRLDAKGRDALAQGELVADPALIRGGADFTREALDRQDVRTVAPDHALHPILPLHVEMAWADASGKVWDSLDGSNHQYEFNMKLRGWESFLSVGTSVNPHGGMGFLEYRNLLSNYGSFGNSGELGRTVEPWNFDAFGNKAATVRQEPFMAVDYMDLHVLHGHAAIGLHRHRDNQEAFMVLGDRAGLMVIGDWAQMPGRERCIEVRTLKPGHLALLKGGNLHGLINPSDQDLFLFMFGGYD
ncbi:cupin domain-containing protein [Caballeronia sp. ATUFL_M2_KS44]|uniref:cupin domain-containing protein n=1 Tax=Caballeronia sp. ATUFL_M2_KS44 TaxID=2921767 RepID=UPI002028ADB3|nr:cupin domain-containing protein [Caballeronia sp. ATUFL_M2_KS44]